MERIGEEEVKLFTRHDNVYGKVLEIHFEGQKKPRVNEWS